MSAKPPGEFMWSLEDGEDSAAERGILEREPLRLRAESERLAEVGEALDLWGMESERLRRRRDAPPFSLSSSILSSLAIRCRAPGVLSGPRRFGTGS